MENPGADLAARRKKAPKRCLVCGKEFVARETAKTCGATCRSRFFQLKKGKDMLKITPAQKEWQDEQVAVGNARVIAMSPDEFLRLAGGNIEHGERLDFERFAAESEIFYLEADANTGVVFTHEGRHRAVAARNSGYSQIPVLVVVMNYAAIKEFASGNMSAHESLAAQDNLTFPETLHPPEKRAR